MFNVVELFWYVGVIGDWVVILVLQGIEYVVGFFGVLQVGCIVVLLLVLYVGVYDECMILVLSDILFVVILMMLGVVDDVRECVQLQLGQFVLLIVEFDLLDLDFWQCFCSFGVCLIGRDMLEIVYL